MANSIMRGATCRLVFYPQNGVSVADLGTPTVAISQELTFLTFEGVVDAQNNRVYVDLEEPDTVQLVENVETKVQVVYTNDEDITVYRFPIHTLKVEPSIFGQFYTPVVYMYLEVDPDEEGYSEQNPQENNWYERLDDVYYPTEDTSPVEGTTYYVQYDEEDVEVPSTDAVTLIDERIVEEEEEGEYDIDDEFDGQSDEVFYLQDINDEDALEEDMIPDIVEEQYVTELNPYDDSEDVIDEP